MIKIRFYILVEYRLEYRVAGFAQDAVALLIADFVISAGGSVFNHQ
jgi:hypothetical protein